MTLELPDANWDLTFGEYQEIARETAIYPNNSKVVYPVLGMAGEAGEVANKVKKIIRDGLDVEDVREDLAKELGDVMWYVSNVAYDLGLDLAYIANLNLQRLRDRKERGVLGGSGDNR